MGQDLVPYNMSDQHLAGIKSADTGVSAAENEVDEISAPYITGEELAKRLSVSKKMISNRSYDIVGRVKVGGAVRYNWQEIDYTLKMGKNPIKGASHVY